MIYYPTVMARCSLFVLKVSLNPSKQRNKPNKNDRISVVGCMRLIQLHVVTSPSPVDTVSFTSSRCFLLASVEMFHVAANLNVILHFVKSVFPGDNTVTASFCCVEVFFFSILKPGA